MTAGALPAIAVTALPANAFTAAPNNVQFTLEGCRFFTGLSLPISGVYVCPNTAYTTGNLGKGWNELDLVPHRLTTTYSGSGTTSYDVVIAADNETAGTIGYDHISAPVPSASGLTTSSTCLVNSTAQATAGSVTGGADHVIYRTLTVTQSAGACVLDYYERLALGSSNYSGSSLQSYMFERDNFSTGKRTVSIPVKQILPQQLTNDLSASRDSAVTWSVTKTAEPFSSPSNTCDGTSGKQSTLIVKVDYTKVSTDPNGYNLVATVTATNPASRLLKIWGTDAVRSGTNVLQTLTFGSVGSPIDLPPHTTVTLLDHVVVGPIAANDPSLASPVAFNSIVTGHYIDPVVSSPAIPDKVVNATVSSILTGTTSNNTVDFSDAFSLTTPGSNLTYSLDWVSATKTGNATGDLVDGSVAYNDLAGGSYTLGTATTRPILWSLTGQTASLTRWFGETVYAQTASTASGTLSDTAKITVGSGGTLQVLDDATVSTTVAPSAQVSASIYKTMNQTFAVDKTFNFQLHKSSDDSVVGSVSQTITAGHTDGTSTAVTGLDPAQSYYWTESATAPFAAKVKGDLSAIGYTLVAGDATSCTVQQEIDNNADPVTAQVAKVTLPASTTHWAFTLRDVTAGTDLETLSDANTIPDGVVAGAGYALFASALDQDGHVYSITENMTAGQLSGYDLTTIDGDILVNSVSDTTTTVTKSTSSKSCSFTLDLTKHSGGVFECTFTNTERGTISVHKTKSNGPLESGDAFDFQLYQGASASDPGTLIESGQANFANSGNFTFTTKLQPGTYQLCEFVAPGWSSSIQTMAGAFQYGGGTPDADNAWICAPVSVSSESESTLNITTNVDNSPPPGGMAKTIGFWKNWSSCKASGGKQRPILDQTLAASMPNGIVVSAGTGTYPAFGPTYYLVLHGDTSTPNVAPDCQAAVNLLNKSTTTTGVKSAKDPAFGLAAQLTAAELNYTAGAAQTVTSAINSAVLLLGKYHFNGATHTNISGPDAQLMKQLASTLDNYNNNI